MRYTILICFRLTENQEKKDYANLRKVAIFNVLVWLRDSDTLMWMQTKHRAVLLGTPKKTLRECRIIHDYTLLACAPYFP